MGFVCMLRSRDNASPTPAGAAVDLSAVTWKAPWYAEARSHGVARTISGIDDVIGNRIVSTTPLSDAQQFVRGRSGCCGDIRAGAHTASGSQRTGAR